MFTEEDKILIKDLGLENFSEDEQAFYVQSFFKSLQLRVGLALEDKLTDEQLEAFGKISESGDDTAAMDWLKRTVPDFDQVIAKEREALKQEIRQSGDDIRSALGKESS